MFPSEQLGKEASVLEQLQLGTIQIYCENAFFLQKWTPDIKWMSASFLFDDREHWVRFVNSSPMVKDPGSTTSRKRLASCRSAI